MHYQMLKLIIERCGEHERESDNAPLGYSQDQLEDAILQLDGDIKTGRGTASELRSIEWLDALAARWERRIAFLQNGCNCGPQSYHQGLIDAHGDCLKNLRAEMESASNGLISRAGETK